VYQRTQVLPGFVCFCRWRADLAAYVERYAIIFRMTLRIGILGGMFDPIHYGHLASAKAARMALGLARVLFVPAAQPPHKVGEACVAPDDRLAMVRLACAGNAFFDVSLSELERPGRSYTVDTLAELRDAGLGELHFILGADAAIGFPDWRSVERILDLARLVIVERPGTTLDVAALMQRLPGLCGRLTVLEGPRLRISSSELRRRVAAGQPIRYQTPDAVVAYIAAHGLYQIADSR
jgi:nicotinate-nucleotide adenylyltransferase